MLKILEAEEAAEDEREYLLLGVKDIAEKMRLEKILGAERAKAQYLMQILSDKHDQELKQLIHG